MRKLTLIMEIDLKKQNVYIGEESGAGAKYNYTNINELADRIKFYLVNYCENEIDRKNIKLRKKGKNDCSKNIKCYD